MGASCGRCAICSATRPRYELAEPPMQFRAVWESKGTYHEHGELCCRDHRIELMDGGGRVYGPVEAQASPRLLANGE